MTTCWSCSPLQVEVERIDASALANLPEARLRRYNQVLLEQARTLEAQVLERAAVFAMDFGMEPRDATPADAERAFDATIIEARAKGKEIARLADRLAQPQQHRAALEELALQGEQDALDELTELEALFGGRRPRAATGERKRRRKRRKRCRGAPMARQGPVERSASASARTVSVSVIRFRFGRILLHPDARAARSSPHRGRPYSARGSPGSSRWGERRSRVPIELGRVEPVVERHPALARAQRHGGVEHVEAVRGTHEQPPVVSVVAGQLVARQDCAQVGATAAALRKDAGGEAGRA